MATPAEYPKTSTNKLGRLAKRGQYLIFPPSSLPPNSIPRASPIFSTAQANANRTSPGAYDFATIHHLINTCPILHVSFNDPEQPFPVVLPMLGCMGNYADQEADDTGGQDLYIHGYISGRIFKQAKDGELPITIAASFLDGLVLSLTPFHNSCNSPEVCRRTR
jgi:hypothetical protein